MGAVKFHPSEGGSPSDPQQAGLAPHTDWAEHVHGIVGQGLPPLNGEAQGVLVLSAMGQRGGQAGGATGHACAPGGRQPSLGSQCPQHLGWGRITMFVSFPAPLSRVHPVQGSDTHTPRGPSPGCKPLPLQALGLISPGQAAGHRRGTRRVLRWLQPPQLPLQGDQGLHSSRRS